MNKIIRITFDQQDNVLQIKRADGTIRTRSYTEHHWRLITFAILGHQVSTNRRDWMNYDSYGEYGIYPRYTEFTRYEEIA